MHKATCLPSCMSLLLSPDDSTRHSLRQMWRRRPNFVLIPSFLLPPSFSFSCPSCSACPSSSDHSYPPCMPLHTARRRHPAGRVAQWSTGRSCRHWPARSRLFCRTRCCTPEQVSAGGFLDGCPREGRRRPWQKMAFGLGCQMSGVSV